MKAAITILSEHNLKDIAGGSYEARNGFDVLIKASGNVTLTWRFYAKGGFCGL
ncbi:hypothetical protein O9929_00870 [Vibrio lentus]|nr:hypothetical protein [Vibrio lentus]